MAASQDFTRATWARATGVGELLNAAEDAGVEPRAIVRAQCACACPLVDDATRCAWAAAWAAGDDVPNYDANDAMEHSNAALETAFAEMSDRVDDVALDTLAPVLSRLRRAAQYELERRFVALVRAHIPWSVMAKAYAMRR